MTTNERTQAIERLEKIFGFKVPLDGLLSAVFRMPTVDIVALDEKLMKKHNYSGSMDGFIRQFYGDEAAQILDSL